MVGVTSIGLSCRSCHRARLGGEGVHGQGIACWAPDVPRCLEAIRC